MREGLGKRPKSRRGRFVQQRPRVKKADKLRGIREAKAQGKSLAKLVREFFLEGLAKLEKKRKS